MKTLVIVSHPYAGQSVAIKALQQAAAQLENVTVRHLESRYGNDLNAIDAIAERFNTTPMLKAYLNAVWTFGWAFGPGGTALKGKELQIVTTAGASEHTYSAAGLITLTMQEVLSPMKASALYVGMRYNAPLAFYGAMGLTEAQLAQMQRAFTERLHAPLGSIAQG